jgi:hypothetical protein
LATNVSLVKRAAELIKLAGREVATAEDAREILGITPTAARRAEALFGEKTNRPERLLQYLL